MSTESKRLSIDPEHGFMPHFSEAFVEHYNENWPYVCAVADLLTENFKQVLVGAGKASESEEFAAHGEVGAQESLRAMLSAIESRGVGKPTLLALQEAVGEKPPGTLAAVVDAHLGRGIFESWLRLINSGQFLEASTFVSNTRVA